MSTGSGPSEPPAPRVPTIAIVGNDALLAARPATAVQLAHALRRLGYDVVVPASWGDELVAAATIAACSARGEEPAVACACPHVARRLLARGAHLAPFLIPVASPPVAAARYLRHLYAPVVPRIVFFGACPAASGTAEIDERLTPDELTAELAEHDIVLGTLPTVFEAVIPPDRRRTLSVPGGAPTADALRLAQPGRALVHLDGPDYAAELAQHLLAGHSALVDVAPRTGCSCSGAARGVPPEAARLTVTALEPPRTPTPVVDLTIPLDLTVALPVVEAEAPSEPPSRDLPRASTGAPSDTPREREPRAAPTKLGSPLGPGRPEPRSGGRLRSPAMGVPRVTGASPPVSRTGEGKPLPRAYVAHRRGPGTRRGSLETEAATLETTLDHARAPAPAAPPAAPVAMAAAPPIAAREPVVERERVLQPVLEPTRVVRSLDAERGARESEARAAGWRGWTTQVIAALRGRHGAGLWSIVAVVLVGGLIATTRLGDSQARGATAAPDAALEVTSPQPLVAPGTTRPAAPRREARVRGTSDGALAPARPRSSRRATQRSASPEAAGPDTDGAAAARLTSPPAATVTPRPAPAESVAPPPPAATPPRQGSATARPDSATAEAAAIQREIARRRARLDSLARMVDSLGGRRRP